MNEKMLGRLREELWKDGEFSNAVVGCDMVIFDHLNDEIVDPLGRWARVCDAAVAAFRRALEAERTEPE